MIESDLQAILAEVRALRAEVRQLRETQPEKWIDAAQASKLDGRSAQALTKCAQRGTLADGAQKIGGRWRFRESAFAGRAK